MRRFCEAVEVDPVVLVTKETRLAVVAALDEMHGHAGDVEAGFAGHLALLRSRLLWFKYVHLFVSFILFVFLKMTPTPFLRIGREAEPTFFRGGLTAWAKAEYR
jgi:hypothetical protein